MRRSVAVPHPGGRQSPGLWLFDCSLKDRMLSRSLGQREAPHARDELRRMSDVTSSLYVDAQSFFSHPNQCTHIWQINLA